MKLRLFDTLKQEKYIGENRCEPCTILNLIIAGLFSTFAARKSKRLATICLGISIGLIYRQWLVRVLEFPRLCPYYAIPLICATGSVRASPCQSDVAG